MDDSQYIFKAVELADAFVPIGPEQWSITGADNFSIAQSSITDGPEKWFLDALAAQLVRQVDALGANVRVSKDKTTIFPSVKADPYWQNITKLKGPDRTMNTIKAIVDSGVLQQREQG